MVPVNFKSCFSLRPTDRVDFGEAAYSWLQSPKCQVRPGPNRAEDGTPLECVSQRHRAEARLYSSVQPPDTYFRYQCRPNLTTMSDPRLPPELLDHIVSFLREDVESQTLKNCCLVAKSWVPRARKRLFGAIWIPSRVGFEAWWKVFPDPDSSPGHYTRSLTFRTVGFLFSGVPGGCSLIRPFSNVVRLEMVSCEDISHVRFLP
jgi:hypothetical protein